MVTLWTAADFASQYPRAFHLSEVGSWGNIQRLGLLSTSRLLDLFEIRPSARHALEAHRRPELVTLQHPRHGRAILRDQKPLSESKLAGCLDDGVTVEQWLRLINVHSFFWITKDRLAGLRQARAYKAKRQLMLTVDTRSMLSENIDRTFLTDRNTGTTNPFAHSRGLGTFVKLIECNRKRPVVELAIREGVPDVARYVLRAEDIGGGVKPVLLYAKRA